MSETAQATAPHSTPVEAHETLRQFEGKFKAEVKLWMGPGDPHVSTGVMTNTMALGGRFLQQEYVGDQTEGPFPNFEGKGFWGFNTVTNQYEGFWIDTASWLSSVPPAVSQGLLPLIVILAVVFAFYMLIKRTFTASNNEAVQAAFTFLFVGFVVLTATGIWFRGAGMALVWP